VALAVAHAAYVEAAVTITLDQAARRTWSVLVVGAGPAGATAARELARRGVDVLLVDKATFPRWKVCGCCLNGNALATLERIGLGDLPARHRACRLSNMRLSAHRREAYFPLTGGVSLSRERFDAALVEEATRAGASFLPNTTATLVDQTATTRLVKLSNRAGHVHVGTRVLLAADGLGGTLLARAGENAAPPQPGTRVGAGVVSANAPDFYQSGTLYMTCGDGGYLGLVRLEDGRLDVAAAFDAEWLRRAGGPCVAAIALLAEAKWPAPLDLHTLHWRGTPALTRQARRLAAERVFVLGDAAGYVEPFTGEGMAWALASGVAVVPLVIRAASAWQDELIGEWTMRYRCVVSRRQTACRVAAAVLRHPLLSGAVVAVLARVPALAAPFVRHLNRRTALLSRPA
jgi:flavin-dependent dehydrogenase